MVDEPSPSDERGSPSDPDDEPPEATPRDAPEPSRDDRTERRPRGADADSDPETERDSRAEPDADPESDADADSDPDSDADADAGAAGESGTETDRDVPEDVRKYERFKKIDGARYERANTFLRDRTYITAREWAIARLCSDFRTETGVEMTKIGQNLPELVPFMEDTYTPQAVNQARSAFEQKIRKAGATFLYGAMCDFFTAEELDDVMYEATEVAKFLLEVEGVDLSVEEELEAEERISSVMREVRAASADLREREQDQEREPNPDPERNGD